MLSYLINHYESYQQGLRMSLHYGLGIELVGCGIVKPGPMEMM